MKSNISRRPARSLWVFFLGILLNLVCPGLTTFAATSFVDWIRYPAEERRWSRMDNATAYFRDVLVGGEIFIDVANEGETWSGTVQYPDSSTSSWGTLQFFSSYGGELNCFVYFDPTAFVPSWRICGADTLSMYWYAQSQCHLTGQWTMSFSNNGNVFHSGQFTLLPQIEPGLVPLFNQGAYSGPYDSICRTKTQDGVLLNNVYPCDGRAGEVPWSIAAKGCALASSAMILNYHGVSVDPSTLNTWLINHSGYNTQGDIFWSAVAQYAREAAGVNVTFRGQSTGATSLQDSICAYGPQAVNVRSGAHWVAATGRDANKTTWLTNDPDGGRTRDYNTVGKFSAFAGPEYQFTDYTGLVIHFHSPGELLITDPQGRRTGFDPLTGQSYQEIPGSFYSTFSLGDVTTGNPGPETKEIDIRQPMAGEYNLRVTGTGEGIYTLEIRGEDPKGEPSDAIFRDVPIYSGAVHSYRFDFAKVVGFQIEVVGGFDGGGQRPRDVNKLLTYSSPTESQTSLPAGMTIYPLLIHYGKAIIAGTFKAELNGVNIASRFTPAPEGSQVVSLPLRPGRNVLVLSVDGMVANRTVRDTDRLVFLVP